MCVIPLRFRHYPFGFQILCLILHLHGKTYLDFVITKAQFNVINFQTLSVAHIQTDTEGWHRLHGHKTTARTNKTPTHQGHGAWHALVLLVERKSWPTVGSRQ